MSHSRHEAPRELVAVLWSIAGIFALFFAISVSSLFIIRTYFSVDAQATTTTVEKPTNGKCKEGFSAIAVNNYPGPDNINKYVPGNAAYKTGEVVKPLGGTNFRCTQICAPGLSSVAGSETENRAKVAEYLKGGKLGGKDIMFVENGEAFMKKWELWNKETDATKKNAIADELQRTVIQSQSKPDCLGPISEDYGEFTTSKGEKVEINKPNTTAKEAEEVGKVPPKTVENPPAEKKDPLDQPLAGAAPDKIGVPTGQQVGNVGGGQKDTGPTAQELEKARKNLNDCVYKSLNLYNKVNAQTAAWQGAGIKYEDMNLYFKTVTALSQRRKTTQDPIGDLAKCRKLLAKLDKVDNTVITYSTNKKRTDSKFDPWDEEGNNNQGYGFSPQEKVQRAYNKEVYSYWTVPKKQLTAFGYGWVVKAQTGSFKNKLFATFVMDKKTKQWYWSLHAYSTAYRTSPSTTKWTRYDPAKYGLGGFETGGGIESPKYMPPPFDNMQYIDNSIPLP